MNYRETVKVFLLKCKLAEPFAPPLDWKNDCQYFEIATFFFRFQADGSEKCRGNDTDGDNGERLSHSTSDNSPSV